MKKQVAYLQKLFYDLWNDFGSAYLIVSHSDRTRIGRRGFTEEEKKQGLILIFSNRTNNRLEWDAEGNLSCELAFGPRKEDIQVHHDDLRGVFSPEAGVQFLRGNIDTKPAAPAEPDAGEDAAGQVVSLSTYRRRRRTNGPDEQQ